MKQINKFLFILIVSSVYTIAGAQDSTKVEKLSSTDSLMISYKVKWAEKSFENMAYYKAKESFEELISKGFVNADIMRMLAISCSKIGDNYNAEKYYTELLENYTYTADDAYNYAQTLKYIGKYQESDKWMDIYSKMNSADSRNERQGETSVKLKSLKESSNFSIQSVQFNSEYSDFGPSLFGGNLYFSSARQDDNVVNMKYAWNEKPYLDVYVIDSAGKGKSNIPEFINRPTNSRFHDGPVCFSPDSSEMFLTRNGMFYYFPKKSGDGISNLRILQLTRKKNKWKKPIELPFNSKEYSTGHPSLTPDGKRLYFASDMPGGVGASDIYYSDKTDSGWSKPVNLGTVINTEGNEMFPFFHASGLLYFSSDGQLGFGGLDVFVAKQTEKGYKVKNLGSGINSESDDFSLITDNSGKFGYFSSNRSGGKGDDDIYQFDVLKPIVFDLGLRVLAIDKETGKSLENIVLNIGEENKTMQKTTVKDSVFSSEISPDKKYQLEIEKEGYTKYAAVVTPETATILDGIIEIKALLDKIPPYGIYGKVYIKETNEAVPEFKVSIKAITRDTNFVILSDAMGEFKTKLEKETTYELFFEKEGFFTKRAAYSTYDRPAGYVNLNEYVDLSFEKIELNKTIEIPNIYYDLGKWNIRKDAAIELDKVVLFLQDNTDIKIELGSHTDSRGTVLANQTLSQKRAQSAVDYIVSKGIAGDRITAKGYGESKIKNQCADGIKCSEDEHQQNRRTEIRIVGF